MSCDQPSILYKFPSLLNLPPMMEVASFSGLSLPLIYEPVSDYTLEASKVVNQQLAASVRHL